jgi:hypothetical protein
VGFCSQLSPVIWFQNIISKSPKEKIYLDHNRLNSGRFGTIGDLIESKFKRIAGVKTAEK